MTGRGAGMRPLGHFGIFLVSFFGVVAASKPARAGLGECEPQIVTALARLAGESVTFKNALGVVDCPASGRFYYRGGALAGDIDGRWYYPNGALAGDVGGRWYYPNGALAGDWGG